MLHLDTALIAAAAIVAAVVVYRVLFNPALSRAVARAAQSGELEPVRDALRTTTPARRRPVAYNAAIEQLWSAYERELAVPLVEDFVVAHPQEPRQPQHQHEGQAATSHHGGCRYGVSVAMRGSAVHGEGESPADPPATSR